MPLLSQSINQAKLGRSSVRVTLFRSFFANTLFKTLLSYLKFCIWWSKNHAKSSIAWPNLRSRKSSFMTPVIQLVSCKWSGGTFSENVKFFHKRIDVLRKTSFFYWKNMWWVQKASSNGRFFMPFLTLLGRLVKNYNSRYKSTYFDGLNSIKP